MQNLRLGQRACSPVEGKHSRTELTAPSWAWRTFPESFPSPAPPPSGAGENLGPVGAGRGPATATGHGVRPQRTFPSPGHGLPITAPRSSSHILGNFFAFIAKFKFTRKFQFSFPPSCSVPTEHESHRREQVLPWNRPLAQKHEGFPTPAPLRDKNYLHIFTSEGT